MTDIATLMARDPLELTKADLGEIVNALRASRKAFNLGNAKAGSTKPLTAKQKELKDISSSMTFKL